MHTTYSLQDIEDTIQKSFLSLSAAFALARYYRCNARAVNSDLVDIEIKKYRLPKQIQLIALKESMLERFVISSSLRGVFSGTYEGLKNNTKFSAKFKHALAENYEDFYSIINLLRNLYSHELTWINHGSIALKNSDFNVWMNYRRKNNLSSTIILDINYDHLLTKSDIPNGYGFKVELDTSNLKEGAPLESLVAMYNQFMIAELSHNICSTP